MPSKSKLPAILHNSKQPVWSLDKDLYVTGFNSACSEMVEKFYGNTIETGMNSIDIFDERSGKEWFLNCRKAFAGRSFTKEIKLTENSDEHYFEISFNPEMARGKVNGLIMTAHNITSHKKKELVLKDKVEELNAFMYKATHDLRSPLVSLMGLVRLAQGEVKENNNELLNYFKMIGSSVTKMDKVLLDLVSIINVTQGKALTEEVELNKITGDIIESLAHYPNFDSIRIDKKITLNAPFYGDGKLIYSLMQNLIDNAIKYSRPEEEARISIIIESNMHSVLISIADNGIGIPFKLQNKVFDMFYRVSTSHPGTGLGLYIVKTAVERMKGMISLSSKQNEGTSVHITLPNCKGK